MSNQIEPPCHICGRLECFRGKVCNSPEPKGKLEMEVPPPTIRCKRCNALKYYFAKEGVCLTCANLDDFWETFGASKQD